MLATLSLILPDPTSSVPSSKPGHSASAALGSSFLVMRGQIGWACVRHRLVRGNQVRPSAHRAGQSVTVGGSFGDLVAVTAQLTRAAHDDHHDAPAKVRTHVRYRPANCPGLKQPGGGHSFAAIRPLDCRTSVGGRMSRITRRRTVFSRRLMCDGFPTCDVHHVGADRGMSGGWLAMRPVIRVIRAKS
jgi:hypothetical protein